MHHTFLREDFRLHYFFFHIEKKWLSKFFFGYLMKWSAQLQEWDNRVQAHYVSFQGAKSYRCSQFNAFNNVDELLRGLYASEVSLFKVLMILCDQSSNKANRKLVWGKDVIMIPRSRSVPNWLGQCLWFLLHRYWCSFASQCKAELWMVNFYWRRFASYLPETYIASAPCSLLVGNVT